MSNLDKLFPIHMEKNERVFKNLSNVALIHTYIPHAITKIRDSSNSERQLDLFIVSLSALLHILLPTNWKWIGFLLEK